MPFAVEAEVFSARILIYLQLFQLHEVVGLDCVVELTNDCFFASKSASDIGNIRSLDESGGSVLASHSTGESVYDDNATVFACHSAIYLGL